MDFIVHKKDNYYNYHINSIKNKNRRKRNLQSLADNGNSLQFLHPILHSVFLTLKTLSGRLVIGWQVRGAACQPMTDCLPCNY